MRVPFRTLSRTIGLMAVMSGWLASCGVAKNDDRSPVTRKETVTTEKAALNKAPKALIVKAIETGDPSGSVQFKMVAVDERLTSTDPQYLDSLFAQGKEIPYGIASEQTNPQGAMQLDGTTQQQYSPGFQPNIGYISPGSNTSQGGLLGLGILPMFRRMLQPSGTSGGLFSNLLGIFRSTPAYYNSGNLGNSYQPQGGGLLSNIGNGGVMAGLRSMIFGYNKSEQEPFQQTPVYPQGQSGQAFNPSAYAYPQ